MTKKTALLYVERAVSLEDAMNYYYMMADDKTREHMVATAYLIFYYTKIKWNEGKTIYNITEAEYGKIWDDFDQALQKQYGVTITQAGRIARNYYGLDIFL